MTQTSKANPEYSGKLSDYQLKGNTHNEKKYSLSLPSQLNNYQIFLYNRALFGLSVYSPERNTFLFAEYSMSSFTLLGER